MKTNFSYVCMYVTLKDRIRSMGGINSQNTFWTNANAQNGLGALFFKSVVENMKTLGTWSVQYARYCNAFWAIWFFQNAFWVSENSTTRFGLKRPYGRVIQVVDVLNYILCRLSRNSILFRYRIVLDIDTILITGDSFDISILESYNINNIDLKIC